jgi:hypothetical protein
MVVPVLRPEAESTRPGGRVTVKVAGMLWLPTAAARAGEEEITYVLPPCKPRTVNTVAGEEGVDR